MSRLDFAPKIGDIRVTDIKRGLGVFMPKPDKAISFAALEAALKRAGYTLASAEITFAGTLLRAETGWVIEADVSKQHFAIEGVSVAQALGRFDAGARVEITGDWQTIGRDSASREAIHPRTVDRMAQAQSRTTDKHDEEKVALEGIQISLNAVGDGAGLFLAPIRTTSPGLTVYKGGAVIPRYSFTRQRLGNLKVDRHALRLVLSYTPTPTLQLEAEVPYQEASFDDGVRSGSGSGLGNITLWGKYRFFRTLETWGDKQAALRFGFELPTGKKSAPGESRVAASEFIRQQLTPINGGFALHTDAAYSQARHRAIYGANIEGTLRTERDGFRLGHEVRLNTDLEYVLLPLKYQTPGKELFAILETTYIYRYRGRVRGREVRGSSASEFYLAPGLQFTATARFVIDASFQFPLLLNTGPQALRTDKNFLVGIRYLY